MVIKHLKLPVDVKLVNVISGDQFKPEFLEINPQHTVPTLVDDGLNLWESRAIMQYLCNQYAPDSTLYPSDPETRALIDRWLFFDNETLFRSIMDYNRPQLAGITKLDDAKLEKAKEAMQHVEDQLSKSKYIVGKLVTIADLSILNTIDTFTNVFDYDISDFKFVAGWQGRLKRELKYYSEVSDDGIDNFRNFVRSKIAEQRAQLNVTYASNGN